MTVLHTRPLIPTNREFDAILEMMREGYPPPPGVTVQPWLMHHARECAMDRAMKRWIDKANEEVVRPLPRPPTPA